MSKHLQVIACLSVAVSVACGGDGTGTGASNNQPTDGNTATQGSGNGTTTSGGATKIDLAVSLTPFPWDPSLKSADTSNLVVQVGDPAPLLSGAKTDVAWTATIRVTDADCQGTQGCVVTFSGLETAGTTVGLWVQASDSRGSYSGVGWAAITTAVPQPIVNNLRAAAGGAAAAIGTTDSTTQLATWSGVAKIDLVGNGAVIGLLGDKSGQPVVGAAVTVPDTTVSVAYANADFSGHTQAPASSGTATPWFVATPQAQGVLTTGAWTIAAGANASAKWSVPKVGSAPNVLVFVPFFAGS